MAHTLPLGMYETFTYDANGNMLTKTDFNGDTTTYVYSVCCGRLLTETYEDGSGVTYTYTGTGQRETVTDARGTTSYTYDQRDRLLTVNNPDGTSLVYTYDDAGNRTSVTVPSGITNYTFDHLNRRTYLGNRKSGGEIISSFTYTLGPAGNRTRVVENTGRIVDYTYDEVYRLTEEAITDLTLGSRTITYTYDAFGNRLTKTDSSGTDIYAYDDNDRLVTESGPGYVYDFTYDDNGNTLSKSDGSASTGYVYDYNNRLILVDTDTVDTAYDYDADGIRVSSGASGDVTVYLVDKNRDYAQVLEERDDIGTINVEYIYGDDLISQERGGADFCYLYDGQMSTRQLTNDSEDAVNAYIYDAFGILIDQVGVVANSYMYTGEQFDPNAEFYYLRARYMNPEIGRFVTVDPFEGVTHTPKTLHKYIYVLNNPLSYSDPSGEYFMNLIEIGVVLDIQSDARKKEGTIKVKSGNKVIRELSCGLGAAYLKRETKELVGHHSYQKSMGGNKKQDLVYIDGEAHKMIHALQNLFMKNSPGMGNAYISKGAWDIAFTQNPLEQYAVAQVLYEVAKLVDKTCKYKGILKKQILKEIKKSCPKCPIK